VVILGGNSDSAALHAYLHRVFYHIQRGRISFAYPRTGYRHHARSCCRRRLCGRRIPEGFVEKMFDYEAHRPMEVEAIFGNPLRAAQRNGAASPLLQTLYRKLKILDAANTNCMP